jgi:hypothetical protein
MINFDEARLSELTYNSKAAGSLSLDPFNRPRGGVALNNLIHQLRPISGG